MCSDHIKLTFVGDIMFQREQLAAIRNSGRSFDDCFADVKDYFRDSDYVVGNLETPLAGAGVGYVDKPAEFNAPREFAVAIRNMGVNFVTTANNHCLDRNVEGLRATLASLDSIGLEHTGTYATEEESQKIKVVNVGGVKIALVAATYGTNSRTGMPMLSPNEKWMVDMLKTQTPPPFHPVSSLAVRIKRKIIFALPRRLRDALLVLKNGIPETTTSDFTVDNVTYSEMTAPENVAVLERQAGKIAKAKNLADLVFALPHVGGQYNPYPGRFALHVADKLTVAGADMLVACHSHNPLNFERRKNGSFIIHSLGNFICTPGREWYVYGTLSDLGLVCNVYVDRNSRKIDRMTFSILKNIVENDGFVHPVWIDDLLKREKDLDRLDRIVCEARAVARRFVGRTDFNFAQKELPIEG